jgi:hypothetical protein
MSFRPNAHDALTIGDATYVIAEHPAAPGMPYGQEGRAGIVYRLLSPLPEKEEDGVALKVLRPRFRTPGLVSQAEKLEAYAALPGLQVCHRTVLTRVHNADLLQQHPDLIYAVLMPWIAGPTWLEVLLDKRPFTLEQALHIARAFAEILESMELRGVAHCDLSGPNVLLPALADHGLQTADSSPSSAVVLVDVEGLYAPGLLRPEALPSGSSGYAHRTAHEGLWGPTADRYAGAILLAEMLGWGDENVRSAAWSETYFDPDEMPARANAGTPRPERYQILLAALGRHFGENVASLFERVWHSETLADCPTFGEWLVALPEKTIDCELQITEDQPQTGEPSELLVTLPEKTTDHELQATDNQPRTIEPSSAVDEEPSEDTTAATIRALMQAARTLEEEDNLIGALDNYRQAQSFAATEPGLLVELNTIVQDLEQRVRQTDLLPAAGFTTSLPLEEPTLNVGEAHTDRHRSPAVESMPDLSADEGKPLHRAETREEVRGKPGWGFALLQALTGHASAVWQNATSPKPGWGFILLWVLANAIGGVTGFTLYMFYAQVDGWGILALVWALGGLAQWLVLRQHVRKAGWWILASVISGAVSLAGSAVLGLVLSGAVGAAVGGLVQWLVLRQRVRKAGWWILASAIGGAIGCGVASVMGGAVGGVITGPVLLWLLRNSRPEIEGVVE